MQKSQNLTLIYLYINTVRLTDLTIIEYNRKTHFWILANIDDTDRELIFGEIKPPYCNITINQRIIKLAEFMKGSIDYFISIYGYVAGLETYGILICGSEIKYLAQI
ncbi:unnamed protein product [Rhizophagus irregularis]|uniref:Uncharacterized protein n=1 Tax=Rhizophagus irregularis TaxID=588596 RepID=A0A915Z158_9GLOM|nr:unnamed protein product [Rhizophagus irregularis]CAB5358274.1 unnamed protein product [Rhizophagus irregularis]